MRNLLRKYRLLVWIGAVLVVGFLAISLVAYWVSIKSIRENISQQALPLTGDTIYSEIQKDMLQPVFISSLMAHDTFVRDWVLAGEKKPEQLGRYLNEIKQKYGVVTSFLVSEKSRRYYYADGILKTVKQSEPRDIWYFRVRAMQADYETNVDPDMANRDKMTVFINYRVKDFQDNFIGATGVGMTLDTMTHLMDDYQKRFRRNVYFVNRAGEVTLSGKSTHMARESIRQQAGIKTIAEKILNGSTVPTHLEYQKQSDSFLLSSRFIPELGWYLIVEQNVSDEIRPVRRVFVLNLLISAGITFLVLIIILFGVKQFQNRLEDMAATDGLTGLLNRQAFNFVFTQAVLDVNRSKEAMSCILFDVDSFKRVNDTYGHLAGDRVLTAIAHLARSVFRENDIISRWGGEEFFILLKGCDLGKAAALAETLRATIAEHDFELNGTTTRQTISVGVAQYVDGESLGEFFARADRALYRGKAEGRNRVIAISSPVQAD